MAITDILGSATHMHECGDLKPESPQARWKNSIWFVDSPLPEENDVRAHLEWLITWLAPDIVFVRDLVSKGVALDVYVSYSCNDDHRGFRLEASQLEFFGELKIPLEISIMT